MSEIPNQIITIVLADDHPVAREGIRKTLLTALDFVIVGEAEDGNQVKPLVEKFRPQILLLDLVMPNLRPAELEKWVRTNYPETITLVLTSHDRDAYLSNMIEAGASGFFEKGVRREQLIEAIRRAARGEILFDEAQINRAQEWRVNVKEKWESLSEREREVLRLIGGGAKNKAIASELCITPKTVEKHLVNIYTKLGVGNRVDAALWWERNGRDFPT